MSKVPQSRISVANDQPVRPEQRWVLYWMTGARRTRHNFGLQRAIDWSRKLGKPLVVLEGLRCDYRWASDRHHRFILDGMADTASAFDAAGVTYLPYVEPSIGAGKGLLSQLGRSAAVVVTDQPVGFFLPRMIAAAARQLDARLEQVDSIGLLPLSAAPRVFTTAASFRRHLQKVLFEHLEAPDADPLKDYDAGPIGIPQPITAKWPLASPQDLEHPDELLARLPIDHTVPPVLERGGSVAATQALQAFIHSGLDRYAEDRNHPDDDAASGLSPWLHYGHLSAHQALHDVLARDDWHPEQRRVEIDGSRGWWGASPEVEAFVEQLVTWRELGHVFAHHRPDDHEDFDTLPEWAKRSLEEHEDDERPVLLSLEALEQAQSPDPVWNAAQTQLLREGRIHNAVRMIWGKRMLEWSPTPRVALERLIHLNNKYALDGRDPNSVSGIFWVFGRFDRAWGPQRPIFGKVRFMSSERAPKKWRMRNWMTRFSK